jgi:hypothetical protein
MSSPSDVTSAYRATIGKYMDAFNRRDMSALGSTFAEDVSLVDWDIAAAGKEQVGNQSNKSTAALLESAFICCLERCSLQCNCTSLVYPFFFRCWPPPTRSLPVRSCSSLCKTSTLMWRSALQPLTSLFSSTTRRSWPCWTCSLSMSRVSSRRCAHSRDRKRRRLKGEKGRSDETAFVWPSHDPSCKCGYRCAVERFFRPAQRGCLSLCSSSVSLFLTLIHSLLRCIFPFLSRD